MILTLLISALFVFAWISMVMFWDCVYKIEDKERLSRPPGESLWKIYAEERQGYNNTNNNNNKTRGWF